LSEATEPRSVVPVATKDVVGGKFGHRIDAEAAETAAQFAERWRDGQLNAAARIIRRHGATRTGKLPDGARGEVAGLLDRADTNAARVDSYRAIRDVHNVAVYNEPRMYSEHSPNSWYRDVALSSIPGIDGHAQAVARLNQYSEELVVEIKAGSAEGQRALRIAETRGRPTGDRIGAESERRAMSSGTSSGGAFVTPAYLDTLYGLYNSFEPAFIEQTTKVPDPGYGLEMLVPAFTSTTTVAQQTTENSGISSSSPGATYLTSPLATFAGEIDASQALFDRSGPVGIDVIVHAALLQELETQVDAYAVAVALATAGTVSGASTFSAAKLYGDLAQAKEQMLTAAGTRIPATHTFLSSTFADWLSAETDPSGRPLLLPVSSQAALPVQNGPNGEPPPGFTGDKLLNTAVFVDGQIPASGSSTQIMVANPSEVFSLQTAPVIRAFPETFASTLTVALEMYCMVGVVVRHPAAIQVITGSAYPNSPTFA
jgi:HK97 family phage major capsid protein